MSWAKHQTRASSSKWSANASTRLRRAWWTATVHWVTDMPNKTKSDAPNTAPSASTNRVAM